MADIQYLNYGDQQIEQQALLKNLADQVQGYVQKQPWSNKRKEKFMSAYSDIMNRGILGASNATGQWTLDVGGDDLGLDSKDRKDREMYQEAAYFIQQQMAGLPTKSSQEEAKEEEKKDLPVFDNKYFTSNFMSHIGHDRFGGRDWTSSEWNEIDERGDDGLRGTNKRAKALASYLRSYSNSLKEGEHNFEGSPFTNLNDFKTRVNTAISELENGTWNQADKDSLNRIGLNPADWFNNGSGDLSGEFNNEGQELTYGQLAKYNAAQAKAKQQQAIEQQKAARANQWDRMTFLGAKLNGKPLSAEHSTMEYLQGLASKANLSGDEVSELVGAFKLAARTGQLQSLSKEELQKFGRFQGYNNPNRLKKINNLEGVYWDTIGNRIVRPYMSTNAPQTSFQNILDQNNPEKKKEQEELTKKITQDKYWNSPIKELDSYDYANVIGALADVVSIADPEPISATVLAEIGTVARSYGRSKDSGFLENALYTAGDTVLGGLAAIPALGDAGLAMRLTGNGLKYLGYAGLIFNAKNLPDAGKAFSKWYSYATQDGFSPVEAYKKLTRKEAQDLQNGLLELVGIKGAASGAIARKVTKPITTNKQKVVDVDVKVNGNQTKLAVTPEEAKQLRTGLTGKLEKANSKLRSTKSAQDYAKKNNIKVEDIKIVSAPGRVPFTRNSGMTQRTITTEGEAKPEDFGTIWRPFARWQSKFNSTNNNTSENFWTRNFGGYKGSKQLQETPKNNQQKSSTQQQNSNQQNVNQQNTIIPHSKNEIRKEYKNVIEKEQFSNNPLLKGEYRFENKTNPDLGLYLHVNPNNDGGGMLNFTNNINNTTIPIKFETQKELQKRIASFIKDIRTKSNNSTTKAGINHKEIGKILQDLKKKGWLKQGGTIDKQRIQKYKEFINK